VLEATLTTRVRVASGGAAEREGTCCSVFIFVAAVGAVAVATAAVAVVAAVAAIGAGAAACAALESRLARLVPAAVVA
jgi:hypothetical protein